MRSLTDISDIPGNFLDNESTQPLPQNTQTHQTHTEIQGARQEDLLFNRHEDKILGQQGEWGKGSPPLMKGSDIRMMFQNVNGITTYSNTHAEIQQNTMQFQIHITDMCETNVDMPPSQ